MKLFVVVASLSSLFIIVWISGVIRIVSSHLIVNCFYATLFVYSTSFHKWCVLTQHATRPHTELLCWVGTAMLCNKMLVYSWPCHLLLVPSPSMVNTSMITIKQQEYSSVFWISLRAQVIIVHHGNLLLYRLSHKIRAMHHTCRCPTLITWVAIVLLQESLKGLISRTSATVYIDHKWHFYCTGTKTATTRIISIKELCWNIIGTNIQTCENKCHIHHLQLL